MEMTADEKQLWLENKKLAREVKRLNQDIAMLRVANEQAENAHAYIKRGNDRQVFYIEQLMKTAPNIIIMTDDRLRTVMTSDLLFRYNDAYDKEMIRRGVPLRDALNGVLAGTELDEFMEKCRAALDGVEIKPYLMRERHKKGKPDWRIAIRRMSMDDEVVGLNILLNDMTEIVDALERAETADKAKSNFLANMSHEIRTPINAMLGLNEMILRESSERETLGYAADIQTAGKTLLSLVNEILDFSKVEEGKMEILPTQYELGSVVNDLVNMIRGRAEEKGLSFKIHVDENTPSILIGDEIRIRQCALNILTNAVKYTQKGSVALTVGFKKVDEARISLRFSVSDTGIGLKQEDMERLYAPFYRIEESRNRSIEGTGLGMSITRELLDLMGSHLEVESVYGEGSTFAFSVEQPVVKWAPIGEFTGHFETCDTQRSVYHESFRAPGARLLVVDDMPANLTVVKGLLKKTQVMVETAESGPEAIAKAGRQHFDVIFVDHMMPGMDGIETLHELKKLPGMENTAFIALTANAISGSREMYINEGFTDYLSKPVEGVKLEEMLINHLPLEKLSTPSLPIAEPTPGKLTVFLVESDQNICRQVEKLLGETFRVEICRNGQDAVGMAERLAPEMILLDVTLRDMSGFEVLRAFKRSAATHDVPVVFLTNEENPEAERLGFSNGASDFIRKAYLTDTLLRRSKRIIELNHMQAGLQNEVKRQIRRTEQLGKDMMLVLSRVVDAKDRYTKNHSVRVATYSAEIARRMGKTLREQEQIYEMGLLHDIGKVAISEELINKTEHLTEDELDYLKQHTVIGGDILHSINEMPQLETAARSHHERYDGGGYPDGLKGSDIPEFARILCVADSYDAMTSTRAYSGRRSQEKAYAEIERCSGSQFDPEIASVMLRMIEEDTEHLMTEQSADIRIWKASEQAWILDEDEHGQPAEEDGPAPELPEWLCEIDEIDVARGMKYCGTEEIYLDTLTIYGKNAAAITDELDGFWNAGNIADTTVKVHALKSTSRTIGAESIGALAERLEAAGKAGDTKTLSAELGGLLARVRALGEKLSPLYAPAAESTENDDALPPLPEGKLSETYHALRRFAEEFDSDGALFMLSYLERYSLPDGERERCARVKQAIVNFDWDQIEGILA